ncbi:hypothetical protein METBIDRAFT_96132 [Metschnikowia bicuspidata var. bicuspidata NRRL YB-4993]|uniref:Hyphally-regulated cell wall protein N-terminal domain-containing protein n=1 Tax=Metschnikowia bicuspidata var. bicuspidata NRRL YB-4993 TaxID=869754 RepID=A0A1A0HGJ1_9ASCO|nr:hypothetical protein METBIDRAFT_96132 [Metschnikowia bicuspidata var. bicuspidata NRRL YB-4993]OBA22997.1 hypothetical protein METBIDRAFT_96132 [Metschnikowia bicuspidata var. bicuspidata NRRL YB-4993]
MFFGGSLARDGTKPFIIDFKNEWHNTGMIVFRRNYGKVPLYINGFTDGTPVIKNSGSICLYSTTWDVQTTIEGNGCISVGYDSILHVELRQNRVRAPSGQVIYLESFNSYLRISGLRLELHYEPEFKVAGFGQNNVIEFDIDINHISLLNYHADSGTIFVASDRYLDVSFVIGKGYDGFAIKVTLSPNGSKLTYDRPVPDVSRPSECRCQSHFPSVFY